MCIKIRINNFDKVEQNLFALRISLHDDDGQRQTDSEAMKRDGGDVHFDCEMCKKEMKNTFVDFTFITATNKNNS